MKRSVEDEYLIQLIGNPKKHLSFEDYTSEKFKLFETDTHIYDLRGKTAAFTNKFKGKGYENTQFYTNCSIFFEDIPNIHNVRESYECYASVLMAGEPRGWYNGVAKSDWLSVIGDILLTANNVKKSLLKGIGVLIHCSDGWDRTSQISALVQILVLPHYRTLRGFCELIEKEFILAGFNLGVRNGFDSDGDKLQESPILLQFLDAVHQLWVQHPNEFEFGLNLLSFIGFHAYSCAFGNFTQHNDKERLQKGLAERTVSMWSFVMAHRVQFKNDFYLPKKRKLHAYNKEKDLRLWKEFFLGIEEFIIKPQAPRTEVDFESILLAEVLKLREEVKTLKDKLGQVEITTSGSKPNPAETISDEEDSDDATNRMAQEFEILPKPPVGAPSSQRKNSKLNPHLDSSDSDDEKASKKKAAVKKEQYDDD